MQGLLLADQILDAAEQAVVPYLCRDYYFPTCEMKCDFPTLVHLTYAGIITALFALNVRM